MVLCAAQWALLTRTFLRFKQLVMLKASPPSPQIVTRNEACLTHLATRCRFLSINKCIKASPLKTSWLTWCLPATLRQTWRKWEILPFLTVLANRQILIKSQIQAHAWFSQLSTSHQPMGRRKRIDSRRPRKTNLNRCLNLRTKSDRPPTKKQQIRIPKRNGT